MPPTFRDLKASLPMDFPGPIPRTYERLAKAALPFLLRRKHGPLAEDAAQRIQHWWKQVGRRRIRQLRGPLVFAREISANEQDPWTLTPVGEIPIYRFWSYTCPSSKCSYAFDVVAAYRWFCEEQQSNPFDRRELPVEKQQHLRSCYEAARRLPRMRAILVRESLGPKSSVMDDVFLALERAYGLVFPVEHLRTTFQTLPLADLFAFYQDLRWWVLQCGPKHPSASTWLHDDAKPRHRTLSAARQFVMYGFWRLYQAVNQSERSTLLLTLGHVLHRHASKDMRLDVDE